MSPNQGLPRMPHFDASPNSPLPFGWLWAANWFLASAMQLASNYLQAAYCCCNYYLVDELTSDRYEVQHQGHHQQRSECTSESCRLTHL
jgi:hypothetical protein